MATNTAIELDNKNEHEEDDADENINCIINSEAEINNKFDQIFTASTSGYQSPSVQLPNSFKVLRTMLALYVFCVWDCITDILVIVTLSRNCKRHTFQQSNHMHTYYILLTLCYISTIVGVINVFRKYYRVIILYTSNKNKTKSIWNDGFKYVAVRCILQLDITSHCNTEKKLRALFTVLEDYVQFSVTTTLLIFFQDGDVLILLSWVSSLLVIAFQFSIDMYSVFRGSCVKCCKCCHCKEKCYDTNSKFRKITYCLCVALLLILMLVLIPCFIFLDYDTTNGFIGGTVYYSFRGNIHWIQSDEFVVVNKSGTFLADPFGTILAQDFLGDIWTDFPYIGMQFDQFKTAKASYGRVVFKEDYAEVSYYFDDICNNVDTFAARNCSVSSTSDKFTVIDFVDNKPVIYNDSTWILEYDMIYYESC